MSVDGPEAVFGKLFDYVGYGEIGGLFRPHVLSRLLAASSRMSITCGGTVGSHMSKADYALRLQYRTRFHVY